jgi:hypothetical protein
MPYALFTNNEQISKAYDSESEVWKEADEAGLVVDVASNEEASHPKRVLDEDYCIKPCTADNDQATQGGHAQVHKIKQDARRSAERANKPTGGRIAAAIAIKS